MRDKAARVGAVRRWLPMVATMVALTALPVQMVNAASKQARPRVSRVQAQTAVALVAPGQVAFGQTVSLSATARGLTDPLYQFWVEAPSGTWSTGESLGSDAFSFVPTAPGIYHVEAYAKAASDAGSSQAFARSPLETVRVTAGSLVALGDSISFGYDLGPTQNLPAPGAFPYLMGEAGNWRVSDLGSPAWTSGDLLAALRTPLFRSVLHGASVITIDIGSNDILGPATAAGLLQAGANATPSPALLAELGTAVKGFGTNLPQIVTLVRKEAPNARVVLYNLYNPIPSVAGPLASFAQTYISQMNRVISTVASSAHMPLVNASGAFAGHQITYVMLTNLHPTALGQEVLARLGDNALGIKAAASTSTSTSTSSAG